MLRPALDHPARRLLFLTKPQRICCEITAFVVTFAIAATPAHAQNIPAPLPKAPEAPKEKPSPPPAADYDFKPTRTIPVGWRLFAYGLTGTISIAGWVVAGVFSSRANDKEASAKETHRHIESRRIFFTTAEHPCDVSPKSKELRLDVLCARQDAERRDWGRFENYSTIGYAAGIGGLVLLGVAIGLMEPWVPSLSKSKYRYPKDNHTPSASLQFAPILSPNEKGFQLQVAF